MAISKKEAAERLRAVHPVSCEDATEIECVCSCKGAKHGIRKTMKMDVFFYHHESEPEKEDNLTKPFDNRDDLLEISSKIFEKEFEYAYYAKEKSMRKDKYGLYP